MAAGISHEISNPLGVMVGSIDLLKIYTADQPKLVKHIERLERGSNRLKRICDQMKSFVKGSTSQDENEIFHVQDMLEETIEFLKPIINSSHTRIEFSELEMPPRVQGNIAMIQQICINLIKNAIEAMGEIEDVEYEPKITITHKLCNDGQIHISFKDNGPGIPAESLNKLFDAFYTTKSRGRGTGLGLSISKRIAKEHGGDLKVESSIGIGTEFTLVLPTVCSLSQKQRKTSKNDYSGKRALVAEDHPDLNEWMTSILNELGFEVFSSRNGRIGLEIFNREKPDLIITDLDMPYYTGEKMAEEIIRSHGPQKIVLITGTPRKMNSIDKSLFINIYSKPITKEKLVSIVHRAMAEKIAA